MKPYRSSHLRVEALERRETPGTFAGGSLVVASARAPAVIRRAIDARGEGQITNFDRETGQVATSGRIDFGLLRGTTEFRAQITDTRGDYVGKTTLVTRHGVVFLDDVGTLNADGTFTDHATISGGTGSFARAAGSLVFRGHRLSDGVHFLDDRITGTILLPRR